jgi:hypothetical protein
MAGKRDGGENHEDCFTASQPPLGNHSAASDINQTLTADMENKTFLLSFPLFLLFLYPPNVFRCNGSPG